MYDLGGSPRGCGAAGCWAGDRPPPGSATPAGPQHAGARAPRRPFNGRSPAPLPTPAFDWRPRRGRGSGRGLAAAGPRPLCPRGGARGWQRGGRCAPEGGVRAGTVQSARCQLALAAARWHEGARGTSPGGLPPAAGDPPPAPASMSPLAAAAPSACSAPASGRRRRRRLGHWPPDPRP